jgi:hypothetical protein
MRFVSQSPQGEYPRTASVCMLSIVMILGGCALAANGPPARLQRRQALLHTLADISASDHDRKNADHQFIALTKRTNAARLAILINIVARYGQSPAMKIYAMDQLVAADPPVAMAALAKDLPHFQHWRVLIYACKLAAGNRDTALINPLILSLDRAARRYSWRQRPEAYAIRQLSRRTLRACLIHQLVHGHIPAVRLAALNLLDHIEQRRGLYAIITSAPATADLMLSSLQWYARQFGDVPFTASQVIWIEELHSGFLAPLARKAALHKRLIPRGSIKHGIAPRFMGLLAEVGTPQAYEPENMLRQQSHQAYTQHRHIRRPGPYPGSPDNPNPSWADNASKLGYCDWLLVRVLYAALAKSAFRSQVMRMGINSRHDLHAEEGGLITFVPEAKRNRPAPIPGLRLARYASWKRVNHGVYVTGPELLLNTPAGLAQFIFHFQKVDNRRYTGPAPGDLRYVRNNQCAVVIFTSISRRQFDATVDFPNGAVLDLGIFTAGRL